MAIDAELDEEAQALVQAAVRFIQEVGGEADAAEGGIPEAVELRKQLQEVEELRRDAEKLASSSGILALRRALSALELLLFCTVKTEVAGKCAAVMYLTSRRQQVILARIGEVLWLARDAVELARDVQDPWMEAAALKVLTRVHLSRVGEPDAPVAAITEATKALQVLENLEEEKDQDYCRMHAEILFVLGDAQLTKALKSPFSQAREEALEAAAETMRKATEAFRKLEDLRWTGRSMLGTALALVGVEDEDQQMDGERLAEDAKDLFHEAAEWDLEVVAVMIIVKCRITTSGLDCALLSAEDAAEDWKEEGGRPEHVAIALHSAASIYFQLKENLEKAALYCEEALKLFRAAQWRRAESAVLQTLSRVESLNRNFDKSISAIKEAVANYIDMQDRRGEAESLTFAAEASLSRLNAEEHMLPTEQAKALADEGRDFSDQAGNIFRELGDKDGLQMVDEVMYLASNVAVERYCEATQPTRMITNLKSDGNGASEMFGEWLIDRGEGMDKLRVRRLMKNGRCEGAVQYL